jgi:hypothetical protein
MRGMQIIRRHKKSPPPLLAFARRWHNPHTIEEFILTLVIPLESRAQRQSPSNSFGFCRGFQTDGQWAWDSPRWTEDRANHFGLRPMNADHNWDAPLYSPGMPHLTHTPTKPPCSRAACVTSFQPWTCSGKQNAGRGRIGERLTRN